MRAVKLPEKELRQLYIIDEYSSNDIAAMYDVSNVTVLNYLGRYGIPIRSNKEAQSCGRRQEKTKENFLRRYGVEHQMHLGETRKKMSETNLERYGYENVFQSPEFQERLRQTNLKNLGVEYPGASTEVKEKIKTTVQERYGVDNPSQSPEVQQRIQEKGFKRKPYELPSGRIVWLQGYEPIVLDKLLLIYTEDEIIVGDAVAIPSFRYRDKNKTRIYFPDMYIPKVNTIVEVKSEYTYKKYLRKNILKEKAVKAAGFEFLLFIEYRSR